MYSVWLFDPDPTILHVFHSQLPHFGSFFNSSAPPLHSWSQRPHCASVLAPSLLCWPQTTKGVHYYLLLTTYYSLLTHNSLWTRKTSFLPLHWNYTPLISWKTYISISLIIVRSPNILFLSFLWRVKSPRLYFLTAAKKDLISLSLNCVMKLSSRFADLRACEYSWHHRSSSCSDLNRWIHMSDNRDRNMCDATKPLALLVYRLDWKHSTRAATQTG